MQVNKDVQVGDNVDRYISFSMNEMNRKEYSSCIGVNSDINTFFYVCGNRYGLDGYGECMGVYEGLRCG